MNQEINNQTTLFRFVSLRSAELTKKENQEKRFVFHFDNESGYFFDVLKNTPETPSKWEVLKDAANNFLAYQSEKEIENILPNYFQISNFIASNKSKIEDIYKKIEGLQPLDETLELTLWDNLFYQVITQKSFYIKEAVIQLLVLQNLLKNTSNSKKTQEELLKDIGELVQAKVVLPSEIFEENNIELTSKSEKIALENQNIISNEILNAQEKESSKTHIINIQNLLSELKKIESDHTESYQKNYEKEFKTYQNQIKPLIDAYQRDYLIAKRILCEKPRDENFDPNDFCNQPDVEYPEIPEFTFDFPIEPDIKSLQNLLSKLSFDYLNTFLDLNQIRNFTELNEILRKLIAKENQKIIKKTQLSEKILTFGDTAIALKSNTNPSTDFTFRVCTQKIGVGLTMYMSIQLPNSNFVIQQIEYHLNYNTGPSNSNGYFIASLNTGNVLTLSKLFNDNIPGNTDLKSFTGNIHFTNGQKFTFEVNPFSLNGCYDGQLAIIGDDNPINDGNTFIPDTFGYCQLGIADYKKVVSKICKYEVGEVAHIENVMARELREKMTKKFHQTQIIETESNEIETEKITDTSSTERFEMQTEVAKLMQEQKQFTANVDVHSSWGNTTIDAGASYANNISKEESNRQAVNQAKEITQRATERIVSRIKNEKTVKTTDEFTEENNHIFDNTLGESHVSGVFRYINAIYKNQIYNYGKRLMYEFMIPQPSKLHRLAMEVSKNDVNALTIEKPIDPRIEYPEFSYINEGNYQELASKYNASVNPFPKLSLNINKTFSGAKVGENEVFDNTVDIQIPEGYSTKKATLKFFSKYDVDSSQRHAVGISFGNINLYADEKRFSLKETDLTNYQPLYIIDNFSEKLSFSYFVENYHSFSIAFSVQLELDAVALEKWKKETYESIVKGYEEQLRIFNESLAQAKANGIKMLDSNSGFYRLIEQNILRQNCISYLSDHSNPTSTKQFGLQMYNNGTSFTNYQVNLDQKMDNYSSFAKFMEQAFDWNLMSYHFYPYYWAYKADWKDLYQYESNDAIFRSFMQAGMARVVVTVKPGFENALMHYLATGQIWLGGQIPVLGNPLYLSIIDELKEQEYVVEETWTSTLPTQLIALQKSGVAVDTEGLPTLDTCEAKTDVPLVKNDAKLGVKLTE